MRYVLFLLLLVAGASKAVAQTVWNSATDVNEDMIGETVALRGVVVYASAGSTVWLHDGASAVAVHLGSAALAPGAPRPRVGDQVTMRGEVRPCGFQPCVAAQRIETLGRQALPEPKRPRIHDVLEGRYYGEWVEIETSVQQVLRRSGEWWIRMGSGDMPAAAVMPSGPPPLQGQRVRWRGVVGADYDDQRRYLGLVLYVPSAAQAVPLSMPDAGSMEVSAISSIGTAAALPGTPVRVRGRVTFVQPGVRFFLEDETGAAVVLSTPPASFSIGTAVEVKGTVTTTKRGPTLRDPLVVPIDDHAVPQIYPQPVTPQELAEGLYARQLVTVEGDLEGVGRYDQRTAFTLLGGDVLFEACGHNRQGGAMPTTLEAGAHVRLTGVADIMLWEPGRVGPPYPFWVEFQEPRLIEVLDGGAFWTTRRLGFVLGAVFLIGLAVALWAWTLRRRVRARTAELRLERDHAEALRREAQAADRAKSAFLANMSHEIRTPLTAIIGFAQLLEEAGGDPDLSGRIERAGLRLLGTINSVLTFARLEAGRTEVHQEPAEVALLVRHAVDSLRPLALTKRLSLALAVDPAAEAALALVDPAHFGRVLDNLIGNAVKFTDKGAVAVRVSADEARVRVVVSDTGPGIDAGFLPRIFGEFEQETTGERRRFEGSGLGLAITKRLVEAMQGEITVETKPGRGSAFTVTFLRVPDAAAPASGDGATGALGAAVPRPPSER